MSATLGGLGQAVATGRLWAWLPAALLVGLLGVQLLVLASVLDDPHFSVEPDYYRKSIHWDTQMQERVRSERLAWQLKIHTPARSTKSQPIDIALEDAKGQPLSHAVIVAEAFQLAHAGTVFSLPVEGTGPGTYRTALPAPRAGIWEFRFRVAVADETFVAVRRHTLPSDPEGSEQVAPVAPRNRPAPWEAAERLSTPTSEAGDR